MRFIPNHGFVALPAKVVSFFIFEIHFLYYLVKAGSPQRVQTWLSEKPFLSEDNYYPRVLIMSTRKSSQMVPLIQAD